MRPAPLAAASFVVSAVLAASCPAARAQVTIDARRQVAQCVLQYGAGATAPVAVSAIRSACDELVFEPGPLHDRDRQYDRCLLQYLGNAQSDAAARQVISSCRQLVPLF
jgi:hypothetical protein